MKAEDAIALAKFQRPGVRLIVGPTEAREEATRPAVIATDWRNPGPGSFHEYDLRQRLEFIPSLWAQSWAGARLALTGKAAPDDEWRWLHRNDGQGATLQTAAAWSRGDVGYE